jgi:hypothetical protein
MDDGLMQQVLAVYKETGSLQRAADEMGFAYAKVRKVLITLGEYSTPFSEEVYTLRNTGMSVDEIAKKLNTTAKRVTAWLPYEKSIYNAPDKSPDAIRSDNYRKRIDHAKKNLVLKKYLKNNEEYYIMNKIKLAEEIQNRSTGKTGRSKTAPIRLHLKLENDWCKADDKRILIEYGRSSTGKTIERDILVPPDITLHSLHYAIQRLYGWQNSHLHSYHLPDNIYKKLTGNTVRGWGNLIGVLLQTVYPDDVWHIRYGDDDYSYGSPKIWLRNKYTGPYLYLNEYELYDTAVSEFQSLIDYYPDMAVYEPWQKRLEEKATENRIIKHANIIDLTLDELNASIIIEDGTDDLLERLTISSVLAPKGARLAGLDQLNQRMVTRYYRGHGYVEEPEVKPVTSKLLYHYDYGDGWIVEITRLRNCDDLIEAGHITKEELSVAQSTVIEKYKPVCIHQDGMFVLDDVGGLGGFIDMLRTLYEPDNQEERKSMRIWSSGLGWSSRKVSNQQML